MTGAFKIASIFGLVAGTSVVTVQVLAPVGTQAVTASRPVAVSPAPVHISVVEEQPENDTWTSQAVNLSLRSSVDDWWAY